MPTFLWTGKTPAGVEEVDRVTADTPADARKLLEERGWTDLRLHTNEVHEFVVQDRRRSNPSSPRPNLTPAEDLAFKKGTQPGLWKRWLDSLSSNKGYILGLLALLAVFILSRNVFGIVLICLGLGFFLLLFPILALWFKQTSRQFRRLHRARTWHRWSEVFACLEGLERAQRNTNIGVGDASMARYRSLALTGTGHLNEGLELFRLESEKAKTPDWLYLVFQAGLYRLAKNYDKALELHRQALDEAPNNPVVMIDLAALMVERFDNPGEAKQLLARAEKLQLSEQAFQALPKLRGKIAFCEKNYTVAEKHLREALNIYLQKPAKKQYLYEASILTTRAYLAVCQAALGNKTAAKNYFKTAGPYMEAVGMDKLLTHYRALI